MTFFLLALDNNKARQSILSCGHLHREQFLITGIHKIVQEKLLQSGGKRAIVMQETVKNLQLIAHSPDKCSLFPPYH